MILKRLKEYLDYKGISISAFEKSVGMSNASFSKQLNTGKGIGSDKLENILTKYLDLSADWLLRGEGEMLISNNTEKLKQDNTSIPLIPIEAMAGSLTCEQIVMEYDCERYSLSMFRNADFLIPIKGDSMLPTYKSGDIVVCRRLPMTDLFFQWNKVYVVDTNQGPIIKRIKPGEKDHSIKFVSDNPDNDPFELPLSEINAIALVIGVVRLE